MNLSWYFFNYKDHKKVLTFYDVIVIIIVIRWEDKIK